MTARRFLLFLWLFVAAAGATGPAAATPGEAPEGGPLRNLPMQGLTGESQLLADFRGKPLLINIWASYCPPCLGEMASIERLYRGRKGQLNVIGISIDDYRDRAQRFLDAAKTSFPHFIDQNLVLENMLGANRIPLTVLVAADGTVVRKIYGAREWDDRESQALIDSALGAPSKTR
jgi:thiol-disulfide isomerase/thioredoxin